MVCVDNGGINKRWTGLENGMENATENEKVVSTHIRVYNLIIFFFFPKCTLSVNFTFAGKVQQCLVTGSKWNIFVTDPQLKSNLM